jgi:hypothetical protein
MACLNAMQQEKPLKIDEIRKEKPLKIVKYEKLNNFRRRCTNSTLRKKIM